MLLNDYRVASPLGGSWAAVRPAAAATGAAAADDRHIHHGHDQLDWQAAHVAEATHLVRRRRSAWKAFSCAEITCKLRALTEW